MFNTTSIGSAQRQPSGNKISNTLRKLAQRLLGVVNENRETGLMNKVNYPFESRLSI